MRTSIDFRDEISGSEINGPNSFERSVPDGAVGVAFRKRLKNRKGFVARQRFLGMQLGHVKPMGLGQTCNRRVD